MLSKTKWNRCNKFGCNKILTPVVCRVLICVYVFSLFYIIRYELSLKSIGFQGTKFEIFHEVVANLHCVLLKTATNQKPVAIIWAPVGDL